MKYVLTLSVIGFIAFTTWFSQRADELSQSQINKMNKIITEYMTQAVLNQQPEATDIEFSKVLTEVVKEGREMKAHFQFSYMQPNSNGEKEKIHRKSTFLITSKDGDQWKAQIESASDVKVEFMEPLTIPASSDSETP